MAVGAHKAGRFSRRRLAHAALIGLGAAWVSTRANANEAERGSAGEGELRLMKLRHASFLVEVDGLRVWVNPTAGRAPGGSLVARFADPPLARVGRVDVILVCGASFEHVDGAALRRVVDPDAVKVVCASEEVAKRLRHHGLHRTRVLPPGRATRARGALVTASPASDPLCPDDAVGFHVERGGRSVWITGPLPPLPLFRAPVSFAEQNPAEVVLAPVRPGRLLDREVWSSEVDARVLGQRARARYLVATHDGLEAGPLVAWALGRSSTTLAVPGAPRLLHPKPGRWLRVARRRPASSRRATPPVSRR